MVTSSTKRSLLGLMVLVLGVMAGSVVRPTPAAAGTCEDDVCTSLIGSPHEVCTPALDQGGSNCDTYWTTNEDGELVIGCEEEAC